MISSSRANVNAKKSSSATLPFNRELIQLYWPIGKDIVKQFV